MEKSDSSPLPRKTSALAAGVLLLANLLLTAAFWGDPAGGRGAGITDFPLDDGWIHLVYARALAETGRPEYNPGEPETGMSSPLWVLLNAPLHRLGTAWALNPTVMPKLLSLLAGWAASFLLYLLALRRGAPFLLALSGGLLLALEPGWSFSRASGMEVTLFTALGLLALWALEEKRPALLGVALGLSVVTRPEGLVLVPVGVAALAAWQAGRGRRMVTLAKVLLPSLLLFGAWMLYDLAVSGALLPSTFYVKARGEALLRPGNLALLVKHHLAGKGVFAHWTGTALFISGLAYLLRRDWRGNLGALAFPLLFLLGLQAIHTFTPADSYYWARYTHPLIPFLILPALFGLSHLVPRAALSLPSRTTGALLALGVFAGAALPMVPSFSEAGSLFARNCRDIRVGNVTAGLWVAKNAAPGEWVATMDAGAIRYFSGHPVLDIAGLNDHRLSHSTRWRDLEAEIVRTRSGFFILLPPFQGMVATLGLVPVLVLHNPDYSICPGPQDTLTIYAAPWRRGGPGMEPPLNPPPAGE